MSSAYGIKAIKPTDIEHVLGFASEITAGDKPLFEIWSGSSDSTLKFSLHRDGQLQAASGAVGAPAYSFEADKDTGIYYVSTTVRTAISGVDRLTVAATGVTVAGDLTITGGSLITSGTSAIELGDDEFIVFGDGTDYWMTYRAGTTQWEFASTNVDGAGANGIIFAVDDGTDDVVFTGNITATNIAGTLTTAAQGNITSLGTLTALTVDNLGINGNTITANSGALNLTPASGSAIVLDGTINVDAGVITGGTSITSTTFVGGLTGNASTATLASTVTITDNESTNESNALVFTAGGDIDGGSLGLESDGTLTYNPSTGKVTATGFIGALTGAVTGNADTATLASTVTITDNESTSETNAVIFTAGGALTGGSLGLESDGDFTYTPNTGTVAATNIAGTLTTASQTNITALGTIGTGTWQADDIVIAAGGTGLSSYSAGQMVYYASGTAFSKLSLGSANYVMTSSGSAPQWVASIANAALPTNIDVGGTLDVTGATVLDSTLTVASGSTLATAKVSDLTSGRVVIAGTDGELADSSALTFNTGTGALSATSFSGTFSGTASTATVATTITVADSSDATSFPLFAESATGNLGAKTDSQLTYNASSGLLSATILTATGAANVGDDLTLGSDGAILNFGLHSDVNLTHVADTALLLNSSRQIQFGDSGSYIAQSSNAVLRIDGEATIDMNASTAVLVSNDLKLDSDAAVLGLGVDNEVTLTHVHNTGLLLNATMQLQFNDAAQYIRCHTGGGQLDIVADAEVEFTTTLVDMNANLDVSGTITTAGGITSTASSNTFGATSFNDAAITNVGDIALDSISSDGSAINIGASGDTITTEGAWTFNNNHNDVDFIIKSDANATMFVVDAGNDRVGIGTATPVGIFATSGSGAQEVRFQSTDNNCTVQISSHSDESKDSSLAFYSGTSARARIVYDHHTDAALQKMEFHVGDNAVEAAYFAGDGTLWLTNNLVIDPTKKFYLDGGGTTYFYEHGDGIIRFYCNGTENLSLQSDDLLMKSGGKIYWDGGTDTYTSLVSNNIIGWYCGDQLAAQVTDGSFAIYKDGTATRTPDTSANLLVVDNANSSGAVDSGIGILSAAGNSCIMFGDGADAGVGQWIYIHSSNVFRIQAGGTQTMWISSGGIYQGAFADANRYGTASVGSGSTTMYIGNETITTSSDRRLKTNIVDSSLDAVDALNQLRVTDFNWDDPSDQSFNNRNARGLWTGLIAQEVVEHLPFAVNAPRDENKVIDHDNDSPWSITPLAMCGVLVKAVQELSTRIEDLEAQLDG